MKGCGLKNSSGNNKQCFSLWEYLIVFTGAQCLNSHAFAASGFNPLVEDLIQGHKDFWFQGHNDLNACSEQEHNLPFIKVFVTRIGQVGGPKQAVSSSQVSHSVWLPLFCFFTWLTKITTQRWVSSTMLQASGASLEHQSVTFPLHQEQLPSRSMSPVSKYNTWEGSASTHPKARFLEDGKLSYLTIPL